MINQVREPLAFTTHNPSRCQLWFSPNFQLAHLLDQAAASALLENSFLVKVEFDLLIEKQTQVRHP
jgi:hypothetical protein